MAILKDSAGTATQHIYGVISEDGNIISGEGFKCHKLRYGLYLIEFDQPFVDTPAAICTIYGGEWQTFNLSVAVVDVTQWHFVCTTSSPDRPEDCGFTFIAFGNI